LRRCRFHLPLRRNVPYPIFCRSVVGGQLISVLVTSSLRIRKDVSSISVLTRNGNGSYGTEERQRNGGNQALGGGDITNTARVAIIAPLRMLGSNPCIQNAAPTRTIFAIIIIIDPGCFNQTSKSLKLLPPDVIILMLKWTKFDFGSGRNPAGGVHNARPDPPSSI